MCKTFDKIFKYATDEKLPKDIKEIISYFLGDGGTETAKLREKIVCKIVGATHNDHSHGYDGFEPCGRPIEIKSEGPRKNANTKSGFNPLSGANSWNAYEREDKVAKLVSDDVVFYQAGFTRSNQCVYIVKMNLNDTEIPEFILETFRKNEENGSKSKPNATHKHWTMAPFEVVYLNSKYSDIVMKKLLKLF